MLLRYALPIAVATLALWVLLKFAIDVDDAGWLDWVLSLVPLALALYVMAVRAEADPRR